MCSHNLLAVTPGMNTAAGRGRVQSFPYITEDPTGPLRDSKQHKAEALEAVATGFPVINYSICIYNAQPHCIIITFLL